MKTYLISYDLGQPETIQDYQKLIAYIKSFGIWAKPLKSDWFVKSDKTTAQIRSEIASFFIDSNDKVIVIDITDSDWATQRIDKAVTDWMQNNI